MGSNVAGAVLQIIEHQNTIDEHEGESHTEWTLMTAKGEAKAVVQWSNHETDPIALLTGVSVEPPFRMKGYGNGMVNAAEDIVRREGKERICLFVVRGSWLQYWYERRGYAWHSDHEEYPNHIWMYKDLK
jgi:GNAT superfamily N-acetyltransferase